MLKFLECENCAKKPGIPVLCGACLHNRSIISYLNEQAAQQSVHLTALRRGLAMSIFINIVLLAVVMFIIVGR